MQGKFINLYMLTNFLLNYLHQDKYLDYPSIIRAILIPLNHRRYGVIDTSIISILLFSILLATSCKNRQKAIVTTNTVAVADTISIHEEATTDDYFTESYIRYENHIYNAHIKTVLLHKEGWELSQAIIKLNSDEKLKLSFDDLDAQLKDYSYMVVHCNANWQPSPLLPPEYVTGLPDDFITEYKYSRRPLQRYIHYNLIFPNENMNVSKSGNYILKVFENGKQDSLVLTKRFMVVEEKVDITARIKPATTINDRYYMQEVDFSILSNEYIITNPFDDLKVVLMQNHRWDNAISSLQPLYVKDNELEYDYDEENVFTGGNEFRFFDIKDLRYYSEGIARISRDSSVNHVYLDPSKRRSFKVYLEHRDINGKRLIKIDERGDDSEIDADYTYVHFSLPYPDLILEGDIYVYGALSDWQFTKECKMKYNYKKRAYETAVYLKQGYYNYMYAFLKDGEKAADETLIEGTHYETENDYTILVYHRSIGDEYDRLIAAEHFNSKRSK